MEKLIKIRRSSHPEEYSYNCAETGDKVNELIDENERLKEAIRYLAKYIEPQDSLFQKAMVDKINEILCQSKK